MIEKKMRKCAVCGTNYSYCPRCGEDKDKPAWYFTFCSSNCKKIYEVTAKFEEKWITLEDAKKLLTNLNLSNVDNFGESYKLSIEKINSYKTIEKNVEVEETIKENDKEEKPKKVKRNVE